MISIFERFRMKQFILSTLAVLLLGFVQSGKAQKVKVSIYYESLCPDSIRFVTGQLSPSYPIIGNYLNVDFVPYGKASHTWIDGAWKFQCQHGPLECYGNKMQACAINQNVDQEKTVAFVNCVMGSRNPSEDSNIKTCSENNGFSWTDIKSCSESPLGDKLLAGLGDQTHNVDPLITFVPTIIFNDVYNSSLQSGSLRNFLGTVCSLLDDKPKDCPEPEVDWWL